MHNFLISASKLILAPLIFLASLAGYHLDAPHAVIQTQPAQEITLGAFNPSGGGTYRLANSIGSVNVTVKLSSFKEPVSNVAYTMSYLNTDVGYGTLDPQTSVREFISFTGITQNADGSALLTGVTRGLSPSYPYTASSSLRQPHSGQSIFILSDSPGLFNEYVTKRNTETISGIKTFSSTTPPKYDFNPDFNSLASTTLASIGYVASTSYAGTVNASETVKGISELATNLEAASSTSTGSTGARLTLPASLASSTGNQATYVIPVTGANGKLSSTFIDQTVNYGWTGTHTFNSATTTFSATTSIAAATSSKLFLNSVPYIFPSAQGTASSTLVNNGSGGLSWDTGVTNKIGQTTRDISTANGTQTIAHGLGRIPTLVKLTVVGPAVTTIGSGYLEVLYDGTNTQAAGNQYSNTNNWQTVQSFTVYSISVAGASVAGVVTVDATNISIAWTKSGSPTGTAVINWQVVR